MENVIILGAGATTGLGGALAQRFAAQGLHVVVTGRSIAKIKMIEAEVASNGGSIEARQVDVTSKTDQDDLIEYVKGRGKIAAVIYNAGNNAIIPFEELSAEQFEDFWRINCFGAFLTAQRVMPLLHKQGMGSMMFTGASGSMRGKACFSHFAASKAALRNLAQSLAREYGPRGVHVAHIVIVGIIDGSTARDVFPEYLESLGKDGALSPEAIADAYWFVHTQPRTTWTHELDLRPFRENW